MGETRAEREQREAEAYLDRAFQFLVDDFGYTRLGRIPVTTDDVIVQGYANRHAGRQVEISGHPPGVTFHGGIRRLEGDVPEPYGRGRFISFEDVALVRRGELDDRLSHNLNPDGWRGVVDSAVLLLKNNRLLLTGDEWIPLENVRVQWRHHFQRHYGLKVGPLRTDGSWPLDELKAAFEFLLGRGYRLIYDTSTLTPHEYLVGKELRYAAATDVVRIHCLDFREGLWAVDYNGRQIGSSFEVSSEELKSIASIVAAELR